ncbi:MAG TPA: rod shape-determining protein MreC, partial [candidate division CPR3 bacterium]|nr:rod shape-determining protein MreC [candidate division CPR3 bacterium]
LLQELAELTDIKKENEELRKTLDFTLKEDFTIAEGEILWKDPSQDVLVVRTGDGIESGMPVITPEKIAVGRVEEVLGEFSRIRLLSHTQSSTDVVVGEHRIGGVIKGEGRFGATIDLIPQEAVIEVGDVVLTSSLGGIFPKNFLVGRVGEVLQSDLEPFQRAVLDPSFDISLHHLLLIITNYTTH